MSAPSSFFREGSGSVTPTELTRGPWDPESQHAGPPSALIGREIERCEGIGADPGDRLVGRVTYEILRPIPVFADLVVEAEVVRPGRRVDMVEASLRSRDDGEPLVRARAWRLLRRQVELPAGLGSTDAGAPPLRAGRPSGAEGRPTPPIELPRSSSFFPTAHEHGYHTGMEYRFDSGSFDEDGPAVCWLRMAQPLVEGEKPSPLQRVLIAADTGNGISTTLDIRRYLFINVDLTVHLWRMPAGDWVCLDSITIPEPTGLGTSDTLLIDELGPIGRACQTLLIAER